MLSSQFTFSSTRCNCVQYSVPFLCTLYSFSTLYFSSTQSIHFLFIAFDLYSFLNSVLFLCTLYLILVYCTLLVHSLLFLLFCILFLSMLCNWFTFSSTRCNCGQYSFLYSVMLCMIFQHSVFITYTSQALFLSCVLYSINTLYTLLKTLCTLFQHSVFIAFTINSCLNTVLLLCTLYLNFVFCTISVHSVIFSIILYYSVFCLCLCTAISSHFLPLCTFEAFSFHSELFNSLVVCNLFQHPVFSASTP